jgi:hypothetical protein
LSDKTIGRPYFPFHCLSSTFQETEQFFVDKVEKESLDNVEKPVEPIENPNATETGP